MLDAAVELFVHYGYDKTSVDDIAREAGVSKGTIYLHFQSKEDLLEGVIVREMERFVDKWLKLVEEDPEGGTIGGMYRNSLHALFSSPFTAAMYQRSGRVLGNYLRKPDNLFRTFREEHEQSERYVFVKAMQEAGGVRQDVDPKVVAHIMDMLAYGLIGRDEFLSGQDMPPIEDVIEGIADLMDRALTPERGGNSEAGKDILFWIVAASREQLHEQTKNPAQE